MKTSRYSEIDGKMAEEYRMTKLKDVEEKIDDTFYQPELQKVNKESDTTWKIEKIMKERKRNGVKEALVRWMGWPKKFDSWITESDIK